MNFGKWSLGSLVFWGIMAFGLGVVVRSILPLIGGLYGQMENSHPNNLVPIGTTIPTAIPMTTKVPTTLTTPTRRASPASTSTPRPIAVPNLPSSNLSTRTFDPSPTSVPNISRGGFPPEVVRACEDFQNEVRRASSQGLSDAQILAALSMYMPLEEVEATALKCAIVLDSSKNR